MIKISVLTSLYNCQNYLRGWMEAALKINNFAETEFILLHNEPKPDELKVIVEYQKDFGNNFTHVLIENRESLYASWNRGVHLACGKYLAIWNVDDIRLVNSLSCQADSLDKFVDCYFTYGDQIGVSNYGDEEGEYSNSPSFENNEKKFLRNYFGGCFPMWNKEVHKKIGYFDEQLKSAGDFDFFVRLARTFKGKKTNGNLGYYLASSGISKTGRINNIERTVVELRYAQFDKINFIFLFPAIIKYKIFSFNWFNNSYKIPIFFHNYFKYLFFNSPRIIIGLLKFPFKYLMPTFIRYSIRKRY